MRYITTLFLLLGLFACNKSKDKKESDPKPISIQDRVLYPKTTLSPLFNSLRPATQSFTIRGDKDTLLVGKNGTTLTILKNTFVNAKGQSAKTVNIDLVEVNSIDDIIKTNLQTISGDKILQTGGMFFIDAKENNKSLAIREGKSVYVEVKSVFKDPQMKIFDGQFKDNGKIDWTTTGNLENNLIPIPLRLVNFRNCYSECSIRQEVTDKLLNPKFENTYIATREFEERCCIMMYASCLQSQDLDRKLVDIYTANIDKPLYYSDSLVVDYLVKTFKGKVHNTEDNPYDEEWFDFMLKSFINFKNQRLTNTINFDKLGITERTTINELLSKGYSESDAEKFIALFKTRKQIVKAMENKEKTSQLASYSFSINKLGWVNVDRFLEDKDSEPSTFLVQIKSKEAFDFVSVSLVIPNYNVSVFSIHNEGNLYSFTQKEGGYRKLPVGQDAIVVAFSYKDNKPYFGQKKIKIPKNGQIDVSLLPSTEKDIKQDIAALTKG